MKDNSIADDGVLCGAFNDLVTTVVLEGWADVEAAVPPEVVRASGGSLCMRDDTTTWGPHGGSVKVVRAVEVFPD